MMLFTKQTGSHLEVNIGSLTPVSEHKERFNVAPT
ncbi:MAG: hypothetical protein RLZ10_809 [Bacteroidota bacterium]|jgi:hypothetical protein